MVSIIVIEGLEFIHHFLYTNNHSSVLITRFEEGRSVKLKPQEEN